MSDLFVDAGIVLETGGAVLYGAGNIGRDVFRVLNAAGIRVLCLVDRSASPGSAYEGVPIVSLDACPLDAADRARIPVVVSIFNRDVDVPAVAATLRSHGFRRIVSFVDLHAAFADALGDRFWLTRRAAADPVDADRAAPLWADEESADVYRAIREFRRTGCYTDRIRPRGTQYFAPGIDGWLPGGPMRFVDGGAYRGDTLDEALAAGVNVEACAHFEPDADNFAVLVGHVRARLANTAVTAFSWPCAIADRTSPVKFQHGLDESSSVGAGEGTVTAVALDDVLVGWNPTFIKLDVEGAEIDALGGARRIIERNRPSLAVCVYHRPDHLWRIPLLLAGWRALEGYRYYLRCHGHNGFDTVLYASPWSEVRS